MHKQLFGFIEKKMRYTNKFFLEANSTNTSRKSLKYSK